jgi:predicted transcriptional regulator YdeE
LSSEIALKQGKLIGVKTSVFTIFNAEKYDQRAIPNAWQEFFSKAKGTQLATSSVFYGASIPSMAADVPMDYFAGSIVDLDTEVPAGFESVEIPAGDYLCYVHTGPISNLAGSYAKAYMETLPGSGREMRPAPHLEIYDPSKNPMADDYEMTIAIPVN